jgi:N-acetylmuramoyl-L-alanine amidase
MRHHLSFHRCLSAASLLLVSLLLLAPADADARSHRANAKRGHAARALRKSVPLAPFSTVVIDAGHGGGDPGGIRQNLIPEKNVALDVAKRLQSNLKRAGISTVMTRTDDRFIPLDQRVAIANAYRNAIFMCIHFNSATRRGARGVETYFAAPTEASLALRIQRNLAATTTGENRGVKRAGFRVLRNTRMRAVLAECGFLTNPEDAAMANNPRYREMLAQQIARAIVEEHNSLRALQASARSDAHTAQLAR